MPQTIEAIKHAKAANVPMIVAINKVDKEGANPQKVRERLLEHEVVVEAMGGEVQDVEVSALKKTGLDTLLEKTGNSLFIVQSSDGTVLHYSAIPKTEKEVLDVLTKITKGD
jgi:translation elongation factor EF-G